MPNTEQDKLVRSLLNIINILLLVVGVLVATIIILPFLLPTGQNQSNGKQPTVDSAAGIDHTVYWTPPDIGSIADPKQKQLVEYGKELVTHTSVYLGPHGSVLKISNGMNCQNCHLQAGTVVFGNNYGSVASLYPKFRPRSGTVETIFKRINDCFERSLNGKAPDSTGKEMQAIRAYIEFIGSNVLKGQKAAGSGFKDLAYLNRAADSANGQQVYISKCQSCHQANGEGTLSQDKTEFTYPPLWGNSSFNDGAGLYRISSFAKYVKYNMPFGTRYQNPQLTDEEAWDVSAFILSQPRPHLAVPGDWPNLSLKPVDHPFGPYIDSFSEKQHKYGPFPPVLAVQKKQEAGGKKASSKAGNGG